MPHKYLQDLSEKKNVSDFKKKKKSQMNLE